MQGRRNRVSLDLGKPCGRQPAIIRFPVLDGRTCMAGVPPREVGLSEHRPPGRLPKKRRGAGPAVERMVVVGINSSRASEARRGQLGS